MQRALGEGRERAHRLDLVAEELDPERLAAGRREDVDDAAAHGELAAIVHAVDALVARERQRFRQPVDAYAGSVGGQAADARREDPAACGDSGLEARPQLDRLGTRLRRRQSFGERPRRRAHEPALLEHVQRPRPLADEVRRRHQARLPRDSAARQQADCVVAEEPGRALRGVAGVRVLRQENDEPAPEPRVQRGKQQRQRRLRHTRARRQRLRELGEALVLDELPDKGVEYRTVHGERRNRRVPEMTMVTGRYEAYISMTCRGSAASDR